MKDKKHFLLLLDKLVIALELLGENPFKIRAFKGAIDTLSNSDTNLEDISTGKVKVKGVGPGIQALIKEWIETEKLEDLEKAYTKIHPFVFEILTLPGIGPKKAQALQEGLGVTTFGELEYACRENRVSRLKGFGESAQKKILEALEKRALNEGKLRLDQALEKSEQIKNLFLSHKIELHDVGGVARKSDICFGLEFFAPDEEKLKQVLKKMDQSVLTHELLALKTKLKLNEVQFSNNGEQLPIQFWCGPSKLSEKLETWLCASPEVRLEIDKGQDIGAPLTCLEKENLSKKRKPSAYQIQNDGHVKGFFHCHTTASDGTASLEEMVLEAQKQGFSYIGISDHSQTAFYAQGLKEEQLLKQAEEIRKLQKKVKIKIFHGVESDILQNGELDYSNKILAELDFVVASIHSRFQMKKDQMTSRLVQALSNPWTTFWGHPTGRLLLSRDGYDLDWNECIKAASSHEVCIELNSNPHRLDMDWRNLHLLEKHNVLFSINPDAHDTDAILDTKYGEWMAEKAMVSKQSIFNLQNVDDVEVFLSKRKKRALKACGL